MPTASAKQTPAPKTQRKLDDEYRALRGGLRRMPEETLAFARDAYDPAAVARAQSVWRGRTENEYRSTFVFSALASQILTAGAPLEASAVALRMAQDELVHAELCADVAEALGALRPSLPSLRSAPPSSLRRTVGPGPAAIARHLAVSREECALRNVLYTTCITEMSAVAYLTVSLERAKDVYLRRALRALLADETLHGRFGFLYLEAWADWLASRPSVRASIARYLRFAFAVAEREFDWPPSQAPRVGDDDVLGHVSPEEMRELHRNTMALAVVPGLARFGLDAETAYRTRSLRP